MSCAATTSELLRANNRTPEIMEGDVNAMLGACRVAERRVAGDRRQVRLRRGPRGGELHRSTTASGGCAPRSPSGPTATTRGEASSTSTSPRRATSTSTARSTSRGDEVEVDFEGTHPQTAGYVNSRPGNTGSWVYSAFSAVFDDIPINSGFFRPIALNMPEGTVINPLSAGAGRQLDDLHRQRHRAGHDQGARGDRARARRRGDARSAWSTPSSGWTPASPGARSTSRSSTGRRRSPPARRTGRTGGARGRRRTAR